MNVLVMAPHPDDETIGCGGSLCLHARRGDRTFVIFLTSGELGLKRLACEEAWHRREAEARNACRVLRCGDPVFLRLSDWGLQEQVDTAAAMVGTVLRQVQPGLVYLPHPRDDHPDHQAAWPVLRRALDNAPAPVPELLGYEVWSPMAAFDIVRDITPFWTRKMRALKCHASQLADIDYVRAMRGLNQYRGVVAARCRYAEVFQSLSLKE